MIRGRSKQLRIGWISPTIGAFGAVREMIEVSNVLVRKNHKVTIYHPDGTACKWLECLATCRNLDSITYDSLDVLIGIVDWKPELYDYLLKARAKLKAICLLGFDPTDEMAKSLRGKKEAESKAEEIIRDAMKRKFLLLTDSSWQIDWIKSNVGYAAGPAFGGINLNMFKPATQSTNGKYKIIYSGDPRKRKGTDTVEEAIKILKSNPNVYAEYDFYWGKKFDQPKLINFIQNGHIFLDGHRRAGWCNPVAEAIACGTTPVCTDIGANRDFAIHGQTALVVPVDNPQAMADAAIEYMENRYLRNHLRLRGLEHIKNFSYDLVVPKLEKALLQRLYT